MKLTLEGIKDKQLWSQAGIELPSYDLEELAQRTKEAPVWVHFGIGNIFRIFIGSIADRLITDGLMTAGLSVWRHLTMKPSTGSISPTTIFPCR